MKHWCTGCQRGQEIKENKCIECGTELNIKKECPEILKGIIFGGGYSDNVSYENKEEKIVEKVEIESPRKPRKNKVLSSPKL